MYLLMSCPGHLKLHIIFKTTISRNKDRLLNYVYAHCVDLHKKLTYLKNILVYRQDNKNLLNFLFFINFRQKTLKLFPLFCFE